MNLDNKNTRVISSSLWPDFRVYLNTNKRSFRKKWSAVRYAARSAQRCCGSDPISCRKPLASAGTKCCFSFTFKETIMGGREPHQFCICDSFQFCKKEIDRRILKLGALPTGRVTKGALIEKLESKYVTSAQTEALCSSLYFFPDMPLKPQSCQKRLWISLTVIVAILRLQWLYFFFLSSFIEK